MLNGSGADVYTAHDGRGTNFNPGAYRCVILVFLGVYLKAPQNPARRNISLEKIFDFGDLGTRKRDGMI